MLCQEIRMKLVDGIFKKFLDAHNLVNSEEQYIQDFRFSLEYYLVPPEDEYFHDSDIVIPNIYQSVIESVMDLSHLAFTPNIDNFVYDKKTGLVFGNFPMGAHQNFMSDIMKFIKKESRGIRISGDNPLADEYIRGWIWNSYEFCW